MGIEDELLDFIKERDWVTFVEIQKFFMSKGIKTEGDYAFEILPNLFLWCGMSKEVMEAVESLQIKKKIFYHSTNPWVYYFDGGALKCPIAKKISSKGYKNPHWLPVCIRTVPIN